MNFKNFKYSNLFELDEGISVFFSRNDHNMNLTNKDFNIFKTEFLTVSDHANFNINKGSENLYLSIECYLNDKASEEKKFYKSVFIDIYTKDQHTQLKRIIKKLIEQI